MRAHFLAFGMAAVFLGAAAVIGVLSLLYVVHEVTANL